MNGASLSLQSVNKSKKLISFKKIDISLIFNLLLVDGTTAVGCSQCTGTGFRVPGHGSILG
jgi:hypothetical protein